MEYTLLGNNAAIQKIRELVGLVADTGLNVLLLGETGTGKEVVARLLHSASERKKNRFVKVNCAALPVSLLESELFGHEKGAFTGADKFKPGKFELASEGVIFLDEIGDMPLFLQTKLLEVLQSNEFVRLGGTDVVKVKTWVLASTNHDIEKEMKEGRFREDLYYRLNVIRIELPPLRDRKDDIQLLVDHFISKYRREMNVDRGFVLSEELLDLFLAYPWPGNVRELASTVLRLVIGDAPSTIEAELMGDMNPEEPVSLERRHSVPGTRRDPEEMRIAGVSSLKEIKTRAAEEIERKAILNVLRLAAWNKREAAKMLGISYKTLFNKLTGLGIGRQP